jgi:hypothetical protein
VTFLKSALVKGALAATLATSAMAVTTTTASADVACNRAGECWHVHDRLAYPGNVGVIFHGDNWGRSHRHGYHWRADRADRGYYRNGVWITF